MERCPTCGVTGPGATICEGYCSPACWPSAQAEAAARKAAEAAARKTEATRRDRTKRKRRVRSSRFATLNTFADATLAELTGAETKVWLILFRDVHNGVARTGQADIARRAGLTVRGVQKAIQKLEAKGLLEVVRRGRLNQGPSCYRLRAVKS
jgi:CRP-like cAMP-binding protein